jgi:hypothetical protein
MKRQKRTRIICKAASMQFYGSVGEDQSRRVLPGGRVRTWSALFEDLGGELVLGETDGAEVNRSTVQNV